MEVRKRRFVHAAGVALVPGAAAATTVCASLDEQATSSEQSAQDTWITSKMMTAFATMGDVDSIDIGVESSNGAAALTGRVESQDSLDALLAAARRMHGVHAVHPDLVQIVPN